MEENKPVVEVQANPEMPSIAEKIEKLEGAPAAAVVEDKPKEAPDFSKQFAALSKKERKIFEELKKLEEDRKSFDAERSQINPLREAISKKDALALLQHAGLSLDDVIKAEINKGKPPQPEDRIKSIEEKIAEYEQQVKEAKKRAEDAEAENKKKAEQDKVDAAVKQYKNKIKETIEGKKEEFELISLNEAYDTVYDVCDQYYIETGKMLDIEKAAALVEAELYEDSKKRYSASKKLKGIFSTEPEKASETVETKAEETSAPRTLTNKTTAPVVGTTEKKFVSNEESLKRAAQLLRWN